MTSTQAAGAVGEIMVGVAPPSVCRFAPLGESILTIEIILRNSLLSENLCAAVWQPFVIARAYPLDAQSICPG
jgi:hypothetical protein